MAEDSMISAALAYSLFCFSLALTGLHLAEEHQGSLWRYFGAIAGVRIADWVGRLFFTFLLGLVLVAATFGILGIYRSEAVRASLFGIGFLIGARISDWWNSHVSKRRSYKWDQVFLHNPGFLSSWLFLADAVLLIYLLWVSRSAWEQERLPIVLGLFSGAVLFLVVIPTITWIGRRFFPESVHEPWRRREPIPNWATR